MVPQIIVAIIAPQAGRQANTWGRRPLLLVGFAALPIRALIFAWTTDPIILVVAQLLHGLSAMMPGVRTALIVADITAGRRSVQFRTAIRRDGFRDRRFAQHDSLRSLVGKPWLRGGISGHRSRGPGRCASPVFADARDQSLKLEPAPMRTHPSHRYPNGGTPETAPSSGDQIQCSTYAKEIPRQIEMRQSCIVL